MDEIVANLVDNERLEEEAMEYVSKEVSEAIKIKQMELQFEREEQEKEMQIREKKLQKKNLLQREIIDRKLDTHIFIEKEKNK